MVIVESERRLPSCIIIGRYIYIYIYIVVTELPIKDETVKPISKLNSVFRFE